MFEDHVANHATPGHTKADRVPSQPGDALVSAPQIRRKSFELGLELASEYHKSSPL
jgi:hypothetical protein